MWVDILVALSQTHLCHPRSHRVDGVGGLRETQTRSQVAGAFMHLVTSAGVGAAVRSLNFRQLLPIFVEVGVSANDTEAQLAKWLQDLVGRPLVDILRSEKAVAEVAPKAVAMIKEMVGAMTDLFNDEPQMTDLMVILRSAYILFQFAAGPGAAVYAPSTLRDSISVVKQRPYQNGPLHLAFKHGHLSSEVIMMASEYIVGNAKDELVEKTWADATEKLNLVVNAEGFENFSYEGVSDLLKLIEQAVRTASRKKREELSKLEELRDFCKKVDSLLAKLAANIMQIVADEVAPRMSEAIPFLVPVQRGEGDRGEVNERGEVDGTDHIQAAPSEHDPEPPRSNIPPRGPVLDMLVKLKGTVMKEWKQMLKLSELAINVEASVAKALGDASVNDFPQSQLRESKEEHEHIADGIALVFFVLESASCILAGGAQDFVDLFKSWTMWKHTPNRPQDADPPLLELMMQGASSARSLMFWAEDRPKGTTAMDSLVASILESGVTAHLHESVNGVVDHVLGEVQQKSSTSVMALQEDSMIERFASESRLRGFFPLMVAAGKGGHEQAVGVFSSTIKERLPAADWEVTEEVAWPHHDANDFAAQFMKVLIESSRKDSPQEPLVRDTPSARIASRPKIGMWRLES